MGTLRRRFGWGRPGQSTGRRPGRKTGSRPGASIGKTERKRPGRKPLPRPGLHCPLMPADERILSSVLLLTDLCFPKPMKITVCINRLNLVALAYHEFCLGLLARLQFLSLVALCGGKGNPLDIVLRCHGMLCRPNGNRNLLSVHRNHRNMLLNCRIRCVGNQLLHFFTAAHNRYPAALYVRNNIAAMTANIKFHVYIHSFRFAQAQNVMKMVCLGLFFSL